MLVFILKVVVLVFYIKDRCAGILYQRSLCWYFILKIVVLVFHIKYRCAGILY